jgi:hypothetical protein
MFHHDEKDSWEITRAGLAALDEICTRFRTKRWEVHRCFMWRPEFKHIIDPAYTESDRDWPRLRTQRERRRKLSEELGSSTPDQEMQPTGGRRDEQL